MEKQGLTSGFKDFLFFGQKTHYKFAGLLLGSCTQTFETNTTRCQLKKTKKIEI